jgi:hypothetical protein
VSPNVPGASRISFRWTALSCQPPTCQACRKARR